MHRAWPVNPSAIWLQEFTEGVFSLLATSHDRASTSNTPPRPQSQPTLKLTIAVNTRSPTRLLLPPRQQSRGYRGSPSPFCLGLEGHNFHPPHTHCDCSYGVKEGPTRLSYWLATMPDHSTRVVLLVVVLVVLAGHPPRPQHQSSTGWPPRP